MNVDFGWRHATLEISDNGLTIERRATPDQLTALAGSLGVTAIRDLTARYTIRTGHKGRFIMQGELAAVVEQACVVTFDPVVTTIREPLDVEFWPPEQLDAKPVHAEEGESSALDAPEAEPIEQQRLDVGRVVVETLAVSIDPYPRAPDAALDRTTAGADAAAPQVSPFAALAKLKPKPQ